VLGHGQDGRGTLRVPVSPRCYTSIKGAPVSHPSAAQNQNAGPRIGSNGRPASFFHSEIYQKIKVLSRELHKCHSRYLSEIKPLILCRWRGQGEKEIIQK
jgi:hypothetical protein